MDMAVVVGLHKFSLLATINHGASSYSGHNTTFTDCWKTFYCNDGKITESEIIDTKTSFAAYVVICKWIA